MPGAFGTDRLVVAEDGVFVLSCHHPKPGWVARREAELVRKEFPGTCVRWGDEYFEVVAVDSLPVGVRYTLTAWSDSHVMRTVLDYDEPSESMRERERLAERSRQTKAAGFSLFAILTGLLPGDTQLALEKELGVSAYRATFISLVIPFFTGAASLIFFLASAMGGNPLGLPIWVYLIGIYFWVESLVRIGVALGQSAPIGSFPVVLGWEIIAALRGKRPWRAPEPKLKWELDQTTLDRDSFTQREPFLALLSPDEQHRLAERYDFDWSSRGRKSAWVLLVFALFAGLVAAADLVEGRAGAGDVMTLVIMGYLLWEQVVRLQRIRSGVPAGSVLGALVRPWARKLVA